MVWVGGRNKPADFADADPVVAWDEIGELIVAVIGTLEIVIGCSLGYKHVVAFRLEYAIAVVHVEVDRDAAEAFLLRIL